MAAALVVAMTACSGDRPATPTATTPTIPTTTRAPTTPARPVPASPKPTSAPGGIFGPLTPTQTGPLGKP